jgi:4-amino-4-deoxy-L-arabinose transferase-like glycosyltransferase
VVAPEVPTDGVPTADTGPAEGSAATGPGGFAGWLTRGGRPWWSTPAQVLLGVAALVLYLHRLSGNAMSNTFYAAAVRSGTESWKALFFGSLDRSSFITVDKPPAFLWVMEVSGRIFGFSALSMLVPVAVAGALAVVVLFHLVRRWAGDVAAVLAASALAVTPVVTAIFRSNEPDGIMTLFLVLAAWALWSALDTGATNRLVLCGVLLGLAFLSKMLEAYIVLPAFPLAYALAGPPKLGRRIVQLAWAGLALVVASGWWVAVVQLWPSGSRPYIDSSGDNSELSLIFGYNGFGRLLGTSHAFGGAGGGRGGPFGGRFGRHLASAASSLTRFGSQPGWHRLVDDTLGSQISWLFPLAALGLMGGLWATRRAPRTDLVRAGFVFWGIWALCAAGVLSFSQGTFHTYYVVELAPAVAALAAGGSISLWRLGRSSPAYAWALPVGVLASAQWAATLLDRAPEFAPALPTLVRVAGVAGAVLLLAVLLGARRLPRAALVVVSVAGGLAAVAALSAGPAAYSLDTAQHPAQATNPSGGPATGRPAAVPAQFDNPHLLQILARLDRQTEAETAANGGVPPVSGVSPEMVRYLQQHRGGADWMVAVNGSMTASPLILISGEPVMAMGGFTGSEPTPTLGQFEQLVAEGRVRYVLVGGNARFGFGFGGGRAAGDVDAWVLRHGTRVPASTYGGPATDGALYEVGPAGVPAR